MNYTSFQTGTLVRREDTVGFTWVLRYTQDGKRKALILGKSTELPTRADAKHKASTMSAIINDTKPAVTFGQLLERYIKEELPLVRPKTANTYTSNIKHIRARWEDVSIEAMLKDLVSIQNWLGEIKTHPITRPDGRVIAERPMSKQTRQHIKNLLHRIFECAMLWGYLPVDRNPIGLVEIKRAKGVQPKKRLKYPLSVDEAKALMAYPKLSEHVRVMVKLCVFLGMRISEVLALRWEDINFEKLEISICRSFVEGYIDATKSEESQTKLPIDNDIAAILKAWKLYTAPIEGWVFGSAVTGRPFWAGTLQQDHLAPAAAVLGIRNLGWHSFRHSYANWLRLAGASTVAQMILMRHADIETTNSYGRDDGSMQLKREARDGMVSSLFSDSSKGSKE